MSEKIRELYLSCLNPKCRRIPDWTDIQMTKDEKGNRVKKYKFEGMCPYCGGGQFEVVEVKQE